MRRTELAELLDSGPAILGASAGADRRPEAFRVWGASLDEQWRLRVLVSADATRTAATVGAGARLSIVVTDITTFRSIQLKGSAAGPAELAGPDDLAVLRRYHERFGAALRSIGHPQALCDRLRPLSVFAVSIDVDELFDQTPGPTAGSQLEPSGRG